jgi:hypothetical protein
VNSDDLMLQCLSADLDRIETRFIASSVDLGTPTVVHIHLGPNLTANDVAAIVATAPPGAHFLVHANPKSHPLGLAQSMRKLSTELQLATLAQQSFAKVCMALPSEPRKNQPHGPQRTTRKGKVKRW